jgi:hypothetical protein
MGMKLDDARELRFDNDDMENRDDLNPGTIIAVRMDEDW